MKAITFGTIYKRGNVYWWEYRENGVRQYKSLEVTSKDLALARRRQYFNQLSEKPSIKEILLSELEELASASYHAANRPSTVPIVLRAIQMFRESCKVNTLAEIERYHIDEYVARLKAKPCRASYINMLLAYLGATFKRVAPQIPNPFHAYPRLREDDSREILPLEPDVVQRYLDGARAFREDTYDEMMFLAYTGARVSSLRLVRRGDVNLEEGTVVVTLWKTARSRSDRSTVVPIHPHLAPILSRRCEGKRPTDFLFRHNAREAKVGREMISIAKRNNLPHAHPHQLRHTFATQALRASGDIHAVTKILGWGSIKTAERYLSSNIKAKREAISGVSFLPAPPPPPAQPE